MSQPRLPFKVDAMAMADIDAVVSIERAAYSTSPPKRNYTHELQNNRLAHYLVLRIAERERVIGVAGYWLIANEAHIITIATPPPLQRLGLGEWLLLNLVGHAQAQQAATATLEVRPSNRPAISLYKKYGFQEVGRRTAYYSDNGEDALIFTTPALLSPYFQDLLAQRKTTLLPRLARLPADRINQTNLPLV